MNAKDKIFWTEFLELYKSLPSLWKIKSPEYSNRKLKTKCYEKMVRKLKEIDPHANRDRVIKKINAFRTNYKRDWKKKKNSEKFGTDGEFNSTLWYFDKLQFLENQQCCEEKQCARDTKDYGLNAYSDKKIMETSLSSKKRKASVENQCARDTKNYGLNAYSDKKIMETSLSSKKRKISVEDDLLEIACKKLINTDEDSSILAKGWAMQYKELSKEQQIFTRMIIADVLFHGCLEKITEKAVEDVHQVLKGFFVQKHEPLEQTSNEYIQECENTSTSPLLEQHISSPLLGKTETFF